MLALSLTQPWATLVVTGQKKIETRSWRTSHRGELGIHASKTFPRSAKALCSEEPFRGALYRESFRAVEDLPVGCLLGTVRVFDCISTDNVRRGATDAGAREWAFGDYGPGRWAWVLTDAVMFEWPVPMKGALSLWRTEPFPDRDTDCRFGCCRAGDVGLYSEVVR